MNNKLHGYKSKEMNLLEREIKIPKLFHELHGETSKISTIILVYLTGIICSAITLVSLSTYDLDVWRYILLGVIVIDIAGGVVANLSSSTNSYFRDKKRLRIAFLLVHFIQPLVLFIVFPKSMFYCIFLFTITLLSALFVNTLNNLENQQNIASSLVVIGASVGVLFETDFLVINIIGALYMIKLILGFSVKRPRFD